MGNLRSQCATWKRYQARPCHWRRHDEGLRDDSVLEQWHSTFIRIHNFCPPLSLCFCICLGKMAHPRAGSHQLWAPAMQPPIISQCIGLGFRQCHPNFHHPQRIQSMRVYPVLFHTQAGADVPQAHKGSSWPPRSRVGGQPPRDPTRADGAVEFGL